MTEAQIQHAIINYLRTVLPDAIVHHARNEINKRGNDIARELHAAKRLGAVKGFPDIVVISYAHVGVCFLEVKTPTGRVSKAQRAVHEHLMWLGYRVAVVRSIDDVRDVLRDWGVGGREVLK